MYHPLGLYFLKFRFFYPKPPDKTIKESTSFLINIIRCISNLSVVHVHCEKRQRISDTRVCLLQIHIPIVVFKKCLENYALIPYYPFP